MPPQKILMLVGAFSFILASQTRLFDTVKFTVFFSDKTVPKPVVVQYLSRRMLKHYVASEMRVRVEICGRLTNSEEQ